MQVTGWLACTLFVVAVRTERDPAGPLALRLSSPPLVATRCRGSHNTPR